MLNKINSSELRGFLTGLILGDGYIDKGITKRAFRIKTINTDWADYIESCLDQANTFTVKRRDFKASINKGVNRKAYTEITVKAHPYFAKKYHHFYDDHKGRHVSDEAAKWISPIGLAQWFMGDGYVTLVGKTKGKIVDRRVEIATDRYSEVQVDKLRKMLFDRFGVETSKVKRGKVRRIRIKAGSYETFFNNIKDFMVPSMVFKLNLDYETQPKWMSTEFWNFQCSLTERNNPYKLG